MTAVRSPFLRTLLALDAAVCGIGGAALALDAAALTAPLGLDAGFLREVSAFVLVEAALLAWLATRPALPRAVVWALVAVNTLWAVESIMALALGWLRPTGLGQALVVAQGLGAFVVGDLQYVVLRRARAAAA